MTIDNSIFLKEFSTHYLAGRPVWDIGHPQAPFIAIADQVKGPILDVGCGTGNLAIFFAEKGQTVTAIDLVPRAIELAREKTAGRNLPVTFMVKDVFTLVDSDWHFPSIVDSAVFHVFADDPERRLLYVQALAHVIEPGGTLYLMAAKIQPSGSAALSGYRQEELRQAFANGWTIDSLNEFAAEVTPETEARHPGAIWSTWFAVITRQT